MTTKEAQGLPQDALTAECASVEEVVQAFQAGYTTFQDRNNARFEAYRSMCVDAGVTGIVALSAPQGDDTSISAQDPMTILAGIKQFGLAPDGSDLRDLDSAIRSLSEANAALKVELADERDRTMTWKETATSYSGVISSKIAEIERLKGALEAERERCAQIAESFEWVLEVYEAAEMNEATDHAACEVQEQIASAIRAASKAEAAEQRGNDLEGGK